MPTLTANADTEVYLVEGPTFVHCSGTFGSGTITWQIEGDDGAYHDITNGAFTTASDKTLNFPLGRRQRIKGVLSGSTTPSLYYQVTSYDKTVD